MTGGACRASASASEWRKSDRVVTERPGCWVLPVSHTLTADPRPSLLKSCRLESVTTSWAVATTDVTHTHSLAQLGGGEGGGFKF